PEPRADLAVLRLVADRAGQPRSGAVSPRPDRRDLRHRLCGIQVAGFGAGTAPWHRSGLLIPETLSTGAALTLRRFYFVRAARSGHAVLSCSEAMWRMT